MNETVQGSLVGLWSSLLLLTSIASEYGETPEERAAAKSLKAALQKRTPEILRECAVSFPLPTQPKSP